GYPNPLKTVHGLPETALLLALMRQESGFSVQAISHAGARGLMQLMPATARNVARQIKLPFSKNRLMSDPEYNMKLGRAYISGLLNKYDNSYVLALAAYNAGPGRVKRWLKENGDPRKSDVDSLDWIEMIPFNETRTYVQRVLGNLQVYRLRLGTKTLAWSLEKDLHYRRN
ncbi:MAG: lytic transglycosylase domain-containing protein, partial [Rhodospirillaceae bacterium]|nr:lytic transglycosylase domain-containing protein [Rhodospirillaceae bacterium]